MIYIKDIKFGVNLKETIKLIYFNKIYD